MAHTVHACDGSALLPRIERRKGQSKMVPSSYCENLEILVLYGWLLHRVRQQHSSGDKGKPIEMWGRKATGLRFRGDYGSRVASDE